MKINSFLLSVTLVLSSTVVKAEAVEEKFKDTVIATTTNFVERTVNMITTPFLSDKDIECLARNIFYESRGEPLEGKVAVGLVTINRAQDPRYPKTVCDVVHQRTVVSVPKQVTEVRIVKTGFLSKAQEIKEVKTTVEQKAVYQFSWVGQRKGKIKHTDPLWIESRAIAEELARGGYKEYQDKYKEALNFHAVYVKPGWKLPRIGRVGNHIFYQNPPAAGG